ncbi:MAG: hypothetical protein CFH10_02240 [Alphaproteobacteria bacterium MarineAlpha4_Bin2]|nr:MAG: hypothetical protein CFH10_02240 [Alphaproteobacteria bacterium MarineAlpha4_Bin2]
MFGIKDSIAGLALLAAVVATNAVAQDLPIGAFFGSFKGSGVAENKDSVYFGVTVRDLDVTIAPTKNGFRVNWTTVIRKGGHPNNPRVRRKEQSAVFVPTGKPGVYYAVDLADPLQGGKYVWSRIAKQTLYVYALLIDDQGRYDMQIYERTLRASGMDFLFRRVFDGEPVRTVKGKLIKYAN